MAITTSIKCRKCGEKKYVTHSVSDYPTVCSDCRKIEADAEKTAFFAELDKLTTEQRLRRVEEWQYDYDRADHTPWQLKRIG